VWSSASTSTTYDLAVVDPDAPGTLVPVDLVPALSASSAWMVHIYGGTWNAATGKLADPGVRHVVYLKNGAIYRVTLDKGGVAPTAVRLSTESAAESGTLVVAAQNRDGSDALIGYMVRVGLNSVPRYVRLSTPAGSAPLAPPQFAGDTLYGRPVGWSLDAGTGEVTAIVWSSVTSGGGSRLFRTDVGFGGATSIATFTTLNTSSPWFGGTGFNGGRMAGGRFFVADNALRRYDDATGDIRLVFADVVGVVASGTFDDTHAYVRVTTSAGPRLVRAPDTPDSTGVVISSAAVIGDPNAVLRQTRDYLVFVTDLGANAVSIRKSDGAQTMLPNVSGLLFTWNVAGAMFSVDGNSEGNRVWYTYAGAGNVVGSVAADGTDRKEFTALPTSTVGLASSVAPHRLVAASVFGSKPFTRFLVNAGNEKRWVDAVSGEVIGAVGSMPAGLTNAGASVPYYGFAIGRYGAIGIASSGSADAWLLSDQAGSLVRLTNRIA
jgi:hypothetical protein